MSNSERLPPMSESENWHPLKHDLFRKILDFTLKWEGGYVNDPHDPGGETKFGISKKAFPDIDIPSLTYDQAALIYWQHYYTRAGCLGMIPPKAAAVFDTAVNCGVRRAVMWSRLGPWREVLKRREKHYTTIITENPALARFRRGWTNRLAALVNFCAQLEAEWVSSGGNRDA